MSKYGVFSGPYLRSISPYSVQMRENTDQKKLRIWTLFTQCELCNYEFIKPIQANFIILYRLETAWNRKQYETKRLLLFSGGIK